MTRTNSVRNEEDVMKRRFQKSRGMMPINYTFVGSHAIQREHFDQSAREGVASMNTEEHIISLERAALDRWIRGDPDGYLSLYAKNATY
jgi:hypothetical protein